MTGTPAPVFILAPPRSFTSLVCAMLGQHSAMYGVPELNLFMAGTMEEFWTGQGADGARKSPLWSIQRHGLLRTLAQLFAGEQTVEAIRMAERWIRHRARASTGEVYRHLCEKVAPRRLVDKSPGYVAKRRYLDRLIETFPNSRIIHLCRHPRGQCESFLKIKIGPFALFMMNSIDRTGAKPVLDPQIFWHDANVQIMNFVDRLPREQWTRVRGEDLLADPDTHLTRLCAWLGSPASEIDLERMKHPERSPYSCPGPANARLGNDPNFLERPQLRPGRGSRPLSLEGPLSWRPDGVTFHPRVCELARELGYE